VLKVVGNPKEDIMEVVGNPMEDMEEDVCTRSLVLTTCRSCSSNGNEEVEQNTN